jgi:hypothetical protein
MISYETDGSPTPLIEDDREWALFLLFGVAELDADLIGFEQHVDWIRGRPFDSPDEWLGEEGNRFRARYRWENPGSEFIRRWHDCKRVNKDISLCELRDRIEFILDDGEAE